MRGEIGSKSVFPAVAILLGMASPAILSTAFAQQTQVGPASPTAANQPSSPFDGTYTGNSYGCRWNSGGTVGFTVANNQLTGISKYNSGTDAVKGTVAIDGTITASWGRGMFHDGKINGDELTGWYHGNSQICSIWQVKATRQR